MIAAQPCAERMVNCTPIQDRRSVLADDDRILVMHDLLHVAVVSKRDRNQINPPILATGIGDILRVEIARA